jgi:hypothetical protein
VLKYQNLTSQRVTELHAKCFTSYYFRSRWLVTAAPVLWPILGKLRLDRSAQVEPHVHVHVGPPKPHTALNAGLNIVDRPRGEQAAPKQNPSQSNEAA